MGEYRLGSRRADPVDVAAEGIDLAVMDDVAIGVRTLPAGRGVGGVARVHERHGRFDGSIVEVDEEATHLRGYEHALVNNGARAHGAHVEDFVGERVLSIGPLLDGAAAYIECTLEGVAAPHGVGGGPKRPA